MSISEIRKREDRAILRRLSPAIEIFDLKLLDAPLRYGISVPDVFNPATAARLSDSFLREIADRIPRRSETLVVAPLSIGDHTDHLAVWQAASRYLPAHNLAFYEDLPYATWTAASSVAEKVQRTEAETHITLQPLRLSLASSRYRKRRLISRYNSQITDAEAAAISHWSRGECLWIPQGVSRWKYVVNHALPGHLSTA